MSKIAKLECAECDGQGYYVRPMPGHEDCGCTEDVVCLECNGLGHTEIVLEENGTWHVKGDTE